MKKIILSIVAVIYLVISILMTSYLLHYNDYNIAEYGIAAHWAYKEKGASVTVSDDKLSWLRESIEWQNETNDDKEIYKIYSVNFP